MVSAINLILMLNFTAIPEVPELSAPTYFTTHGRGGNPRNLVAPLAILLLAESTLSLQRCCCSFPHRTNNSVGLCVRSFNDAVRSLKIYESMFCLFGFFSLLFGKIH